MQNLGRVTVLSDQRLPVTLRPMREHPRPLPDRHIGAKSFIVSWGILA
jgi:hypothetical protein